MLIHATKASLLQSDAHQGRFLPFENLRAVSQSNLSNHSRTLSLSNRGLINFGSGLTIALYIAIGVLDSYHLKEPYTRFKPGVLNELPAASYRVSAGRCFPFAEPVLEARLGPKDSAWQTNVMLRLKAKESLFKSAASCGELDSSD